jgi:flavin-dependent dehydrogenase
MGLFTTIIWIIATFFLFRGVTDLVYWLYEDADLPWIAIVALIIGTVSYIGYQWVREEGGVSAALGLGVSKVAKPVSKEVEKFKEGFNR